MRILATSPIKDNRKTVREYIENLFSQREKGVLYGKPPEFPRWILDPLIASVLRCSQQKRRAVAQKITHSSHSWIASVLYRNAKIDKELTRALFRKRRRSVISAS